MNCLLSPTERKHLIRIVSEAEADGLRRHLERATLHDGHAVLRADTVCGRLLIEIVERRRWVIGHWGPLVDGYIHPFPLKTEVRARRGAAL